MRKLHKSSVGDMQDASKLHCCKSMMFCFEVLLDIRGYAKLCDMGFARKIGSQGLSFHFILPSEPTSWKLLGFRISHGNRNRNQVLLDRRSPYWMIRWTEGHDVAGHTRIHGAGAHCIGLSS